MSKMNTWLKGKKSYICGIGIIVITILASQGVIDEATKDILIGLLGGGGIMALRQGMKK